MKKIIMGFMAGAIIFGVAGVCAGQYTANINSFPIKLNGEGYNINDNTYFKLRDIAEAVGGFEVDFKDDTILLSKDGYEYDTKKEYIGSTLNIEEGNNLFCTLETESHKLEVVEVGTGGAPHIRGNFYIDGELFDDDVSLDLLTDQKYVYYTTDGEDCNAIYQLDLDTLEKKELIKTDEDYGIMDIYGEYLYASGDFVSDFIIYNLETNETVTVPGCFRKITENGTLLYSLYNEFNVPKALYKSSLDGSNPQLVCDITIDWIDGNYAYYIDCLENIGEDLHKWQVKRVNIDTLETENVTDVYEAGYVVFFEEEREIHFGRYGLEEEIIEKY